MKKIMFAVMFLSAAVIASAQDEVRLFYDVKAAWLPVDQFSINNQKIDNTNAFQLFADIEIDLFNFVYFGGYIDTKSKMNPQNALNFSPYLSTYGAWIGVKIDIEVLLLSVEYEHQCIHPTMIGGPSGDTFGVYNSGNSGGVFGGFDKISVSITNRK